MKNRYKAAGIMNIALGILELQGCLVFMIGIVVLRLSGLEELVLVDGFAVRMYVIVLFGALMIAHAAFVLITGVKMKANRKSDTSLRACTMVNFTLKAFYLGSIAIMLVIVGALAADMIGMVIFLTVEIGALPLISAVMDLVALLKSA